tara:strand:- start:66 stop:257 length:192 start_codon:yes stop_codon:yes gene_type:complete
MQSKNYRLNKELNPNIILRDIKKMIEDHQRVNRIEDTILKIELKDISYTHEEINYDRKNALPE